MPQATTVSAISQKLQSVLRDIRRVESLLRDGPHEQIQQAANALRETVVQLEELTRSDALFERHAREHIIRLKHTVNHYLKDSLVHQSVLTKMLRASSPTERTAQEYAIRHALRYLDEDVCQKLQNLCTHILTLDESLVKGLAKVPLPKNEITEDEVYGPIRAVLEELRTEIAKWARYNNLHCKVWLAGSLLDGASPVKGLFSQEGFAAYKPFDYNGLSDIDIGIGLDRITYGREIPARFQNKNVVPLNGAFGRHVLSLCSESLDKDTIAREFSRRAVDSDGRVYDVAKRYVALIERIEPISIRGVTLKKRGIHLQMFLIDERASESEDLQRMQRKFLLHDSFIQPPPENSSTDIRKQLRDTLQQVIDLDSVGARDALLDEMRSLAESKEKYPLLKKRASALSQKYGIAKKKMEDILRRVSELSKDN